MEELSKLEHLSLVSKICTELDNHLGMNDKDLAEFIIDLAETHTTFDAFKKALVENGAEFPDSFITSLLRIIQLMKTSKKIVDDDSEFKTKPNADKLAMKFPGLAMPNKLQADSDDDEKDEKKDQKLNTVADDMLAELEAFAPSKSGTEIEVKRDEKRERSRERKSRRDRSKDRDKVREHDRNKERSSRRSRSREHDRNKDRSSRRSRSRDRTRDRGRSR